MVRKISARKTLNNADWLILACSLLNSKACSRNKTKRCMLRTLIHNGIIVSTIRARLESSSFKSRARLGDLE